MDKIFGIDIVDLNCAWILSDAKVLLQAEHYGGHSRSLTELGRPSDGFTTCHAGRTTVSPTARTSRTHWVSATAMHVLRSYVSQV